MKDHYPPVPPCFRSCTVAEPLVAQPDAASPVGPLSHPGYSRLPLINQQLIKRLVSSRSSEGNPVPWELPPARPRAGSAHRPCSWSSAASCHHPGELVRMWLSSCLHQASPSTPTDLVPASVSSFPPSRGQILPISLRPSLPMKGRMLRPTHCHSVGEEKLGPEEGLCARAQRDHGAARRRSVPAAAARPLRWHRSGAAQVPQQRRGSGAGSLLWHLWSFCL